MNATIAIAATTGNRTRITLYSGQTSIKQVTVASEWPEDWNEALSAHGFRAEEPWRSGAPTWVPHAPYGAIESTTKGVQRI